MPDASSPPVFSESAAASTSCRTVPLPLAVAAVATAWCSVAMLCAQTILRLRPGSLLLAVFLPATAGTIVVVGHAWRQGLRPSARPEDLVGALATCATTFAVRGTIDWPFLAPMSSSVDGAHHLAMVTWIHQHQALPAHRVAALGKFSQYPLSTHALAATLARVTGTMPMRVANVLALLATFAVWSVIASVAAAVVRAHRPQNDFGAILTAAAVPVFAFTASSFTIGIVTRDYFFAQAIGLAFAVTLLGTAAVLVPGSAPPASERLRRPPRIAALPLLTALAFAPAAAYPLHLTIAPGLALALLLLHRFRLRAAVVCATAGILGLVIQLPWLGASVDMASEDGSIAAPSLHQLGGIGMILLVALGLLWVGDHRRLDLILIAAIPLATMAVLRVAFEMGLVSRYTSLKLVSSALPFGVVLAAVGLARFADAVVRPGPRRILVRGSALAVVALAAAPLVGSPPTPSRRVPLLTSDGVAVATWARHHVDPEVTGVVAPGLQAYALAWTALGRTPDYAFLDRINPRPAIWLDWPASRPERYLVVAGPGLARAFAGRPGVRVLKRIGGAVVLDRGPS